MNRSICFVLVLYGLLIAAGSFSQAVGTPIELPRDIGPLVLGMSKAEVVSITGADFGRCVHCIEGEEEGDLATGRGTSALGKASFDMGKVRIPGQSGEINVSRISLFTFQVTLYMIVLPGMSADPIQFRKKWEDIFGPPSKIWDMESGITQLT